MITEIDFPRLLQELQSLDVKEADNETLVTYVAKLKYVEEVFLSSTEIQQKGYESVFDECMKYLSAIMNELSERGVKVRNIWDELADNPEILVAALFSMPLVQLFDFIEQLKKIVEIDDEIQPLMDLAFKVVKARTPNRGIC